MLRRVVIALVAAMAISMIGAAGSIGPTLAAAQDQPIDDDDPGSGSGGSCAPGAIPYARYDDQWNYIDCSCAINPGGGYCYCSGGQTCMVGGGWCALCYADASKDRPEVGELAFYRLDRGLSVSIGPGIQGSGARKFQRVELAGSLMGEDFGYVVGSRCQQARSSS